MPALTINLTSEEFDLLTTKAGKHDLEQIAKIALDEYFARHRFVEQNTLPLDLSGRAAMMRKLSEPSIDPRKPVPPNRTETTIEGRFRWETDADFEDAMRCYRWNLARYESEQEQKERIKQQSLERMA